MGGPKDAEVLRAVLPGLVDSVVLPGVGHWPQLEASDHTNEALLGFLRTLADR